MAINFGLINTRPQPLQEPKDQVSPLLTSFSRGLSLAEKYKDIGLKDEQQKLVQTNQQLAAEKLKMVPLQVQNARAVAGYNQGRLSDQVKLREAMASGDVEQISKVDAQLGANLKKAIEERNGVKIKNEITQFGALSNVLLDIQKQPTPEARADAYKKNVDVIQSITNGNAPPIYDENYIKKGLALSENINQVMAENPDLNDKLGSPDEETRNLGYKSLGDRSKRQAILNNKGGGTFVTERTKTLNKQLADADAKVDVANLLLPRIEALEEALPKLQSNEVGAIQGRFKVFGISATAQDFDNNIAALIPLIRTFGAKDSNPATADLQYLVQSVGNGRISEKMALRKAFVQLRRLIEQQKSMRDGLAKQYNKLVESGDYSAEILSDEDKQSINNTGSLNTDERKELKGYNSGGSS